MYIGVPEIACRLSLNYAKGVLNLFMYIHMFVTSNILCLFLLVKHFHLFPKSFGEVVNKFQVQELHLSLTQGLWKHAKWGYPVQDAPPGAELWAWFQEGTVKYEFGLHLSVNGNMLNSMGPTYKTPNS